MNSGWKKHIPGIAFLLAFLFTQFFSVTFAQGSPKDEKLNRDVAKRLADCSGYFQGWNHVGKIKLDSVRGNDRSKMINLYFNTTLAYVPVRESYIDSIRALIQEDLGRKYRKFNIQLFAGRLPLEEYIPNVYRTKTPKNQDRLGRPVLSEGKPLVVDLDKPVFAKGLSKNNIALWHSHGWYYEARLDRWEWQRARLFGTVEDISPMAYVLPLIAPMLENAGATTFIPRERDTRSTEVIVDNDRSTGNSEFRVVQGKEKWSRSEEKGFATQDSLFNGENPFEQGSYLIIRASSADTAKLVYLPDLPDSGEYAVYISWANVSGGSDEVLYTVYHAGGKSRFQINQQMGGKNWLYLGKFKFFRGKNFETGRVEVSNAGKGIITADAVRFGGGTGNVARKPSGEYIAQQWSLTGEKNPALSSSAGLKEADYSWKTSGKARYLEGARYYLQYAGMPRSVYTPNKGKNDYNDDYQSRGEWVNYLMGQHRDADKDSILTGLNIPIDLSFAFHTDAGVTPNDSVIGILGIYNTTYGDSVFPNGQSRMSSRDLSDLIQTQIVSDIRSQFNPKWTRRGLWDKSYSEAWKPKVPAMLLELFSHQNLADVKYGLDPRYRFAVSRSVYKGMLRFLAGQENREFVVQPLAPDHFSISIIGKKQVRLNWMPVSDVLEPTAESKQYKVYCRKGDSGFDQGKLTGGTTMDLDLEEGSIYSFRVTALNEGGESFPSEILSVCINNNGRKPVLIVNAFDRISGPKIIDNETLAGVAWWDDQGVPYISDISQVGNQYDFNRRSAWKDDDSPGWGSSYADQEGKVIPGNTFDFVYIHGKAIANAGYPFVSMSNEVFEKQQALVPGYFSALDLVFGEQRSTPDYIDPGKKMFEVYTLGMMQSIRTFTDAGTSVLASGAYIGTDMVENKDSVAIAFAKECLHYTWMTSHADNQGRLKATDYAPSGFPQTITFNTQYDPDIYTVEAPDGIMPAGKEAVTLFRYSGNNISAGVYCPGKYKTVVLGFPFETIQKESERNALMQSILSIFEITK